MGKLSKLGDLLVVLFYLTKRQTDAGRGLGADPAREQCWLWVYCAFPKSPMSKMNGSAQISSLPETKMDSVSQLGSH